MRSDFVKRCIANTKAVSDEDIKGNWTKREYWDFAITQLQYLETEKVPFRKHKNYWYWRTMINKCWVNKYAARMVCHLLYERREMFEKGYINLDEALAKVS